MYYKNKLDPTKFIFIKYNTVSYPDQYYSNIYEVAGHFDKQDIGDMKYYSLHTEYSYGKRKFNTERISHYPALSEAHKNDVPQLWKDNEWASSFADFVIGITEKHTPPQIIEVHPPFNDYCSLKEFIDRYCIFEKKIIQYIPKQ